MNPSRSLTLVAALLMISACEGAIAEHTDAEDARDAFITVDAPLTSLDAHALIDAPASVDARAAAADAPSDTGIPSIGPRVVLGVADFESGLPTDTHPMARWYGGTASQFVVEGGAIRVNYPAGESYPALGLTVARVDSREVFIQFRARMPAPRGGFKFFKAFGYNPRDNSITGWNGSVASNYANSTFGLDYTGISDGRGSLYFIGFGDGTGPENDTANGLWINGSNPGGVGRSLATARVSTPMGRNFRAADWGDDWHTFRMMMRFNSGTTAATEFADGAYYLEIDGDVYVRATGLFNRHWSNRPMLDHVEIAGWSQSNEAPFSIFYDDVVITTGSF